MHHVFLTAICQLYTFKKGIFVGSFFEIIDVYYACANIRNFACLGTIPSWFSVIFRQFQYICRFTVVQQLNEELMTVGPGFLIDIGIDKIGYSHTWSKGGALVSKNGAKYLAKIFVCRLEILIYSAVFMVLSIKKFSHTHTRDNTVDAAYNQSSLRVSLDNWLLKVKKQNFLMSRNQEWFLRVVRQFSCWLSHNLIQWYRLLRPILAWSIVESCTTTVQHKNLMSAFPLIMAVIVWHKYFKFSLTGNRK